MAIVPGPDDESKIEGFNKSKNSSRKKAGASGWTATMPGTMSKAGVTKKYMGFQRESMSLSRDCYGVLPPQLVFFDKTYTDYMEAQSFVLEKAEKWDNAAVCKWVDKGQTPWFLGAWIPE